nr:biotin attachment protein [Candidatus Aenigmarchaeota archaeon]
MIKEVLMSKLGLTMETGTIVSWLKSEGDMVQKGEPLFEVETDKATQVINSFHTGYLKKILVPEGEEVPV